MNTVISATVAVTLIFLPVLTLAPARSAGVTGGPMTIPSPTYELITPDGTTFNLTQAGLTVRARIGDGMGLPPITHQSHEVFNAPGGVLDHIAVGPRLVTITVNAFEDPIDSGQIHAVRAALFDALRWNRVAGNPPTYSTLRYTFMGNAAELHVYYLSDVTSMPADYANLIGVRLIAYDPIWYSTSSTTTALAVSQSPVASYIVGKISGLWSVMGNVGNSGVLAIVSDATYVYVGGPFTNWAGIANADRIVRYNKSTGVWSALGTGMDDEVDALAIGPDGSLYAAGQFHNAGGVAAAHVAKWNGAAWSALGAGTDDTVWALALSWDGTLYAGGAFHNAGGGAAAHIASWNGAAWSALGAGTDDVVRAIVAQPGYGYGFVFYIGGDFHTAGGVPMSHIAIYRPSPAGWAYLGAGTNGSVYALAVAPDGGVYAGGSFVTAGGITVNNVAKYTGGSTWVALDVGTDNLVYGLAVDENGLLYVCGQFTTAGPLTITDRIATWNGTAWALVPVKFPAATSVFVVHCDGEDIFFGFSSTGAMLFPGQTTVTNLGTYDAFPVITVTGPGTLQWIENQTTGKRLILDMYLNAGETVTIDLTPGVKTITSNWRGNMLPYGGLLTMSDLGTFSLAPDPVAASGNNTIDVLMTGTTGASAASLEHTNAWLDVDSAVQ